MHVFVAAAILTGEARLWFDMTRVPTVARGADNLVALLLEGPRQTPLLVARGGQRWLHHLLLCTAAGEPGKQDVRVGGRLARRLRAQVTLLHAISTTPEALAEQHLERPAPTRTAAAAGGDQPDA